MKDNDPADIRADEIFFSAMEIDSDIERAAYLEEACAADARLRKRLDWLLSEMDDAEAFFDRIAPKLRGGEVYVTSDPHENG